jgi:hypothetical protein
VEKVLHRRTPRAPTNFTHGKPIAEKEKITLFHIKNYYGYYY